MAAAADKLLKNMTTMSLDMMPELEQKSMTLAQKYVPTADCTPVARSGCAVPSPAPGLHSLWVPVMCVRVVQSRVPGKARGAA